MKIKTVIVPVTYRCNLYCDFCFASAQKNCRLSMPLSYFENRIAELREMGLEQIIFTGGEALLHPDIYELMTIAKKYKLKTKLLTNGTVPSILKYTQLVDSAHVSIDGTERTHDRIRGKIGAFERTIDTIQLLKGEVNCSITMTVSEDNVMEIEDVYLLAMKLNVQSIEINPIFPSGRARDRSIETPFYQKVFEEIKRVYKKYAFRVPLFTSITSLQKFYENMPKKVENLFSSIWFDQNGKYSFFPLPEFENPCLLLDDLNIKFNQQDFTKYLLLDRGDEDGDDNLVDQTLFLKNKFIKFLIEMN